MMRSLAVRQAAWKRESRLGLCLVAVVLAGCQTASPGVTRAQLWKELRWDDQPPPWCPCESSLSASGGVDDCESEEEETLGTEEAPEDGDARWPAGIRAGAEYD